MSTITLSSVLCSAGGGIRGAAAGARTPRPSMRCSPREPAPGASTTGARPARTGSGSPPTSPTSATRPSEMSPGREEGLLHQRLQRAGHPDAARQSRARRSPTSTAPSRRQKHRVGGEMLTLDEIENQLRETGDARIHFGIVCASKSCPPLAPKAFTAANVSDDAGPSRPRVRQRPVQERRSTGRGKVALSKIFFWNRKEFERTAARSRSTSRSYVATRRPPRGWPASTAGARVSRVRLGPESALKRAASRCRPCVGAVAFPARKNSPSSEGLEEIASSPSLTETVPAPPLQEAWGTVCLPGGDDPAHSEAGAGGLGPPAPPLALFRGRRRRGRGRLGRARRGPRFPTGQPSPGEPIRRAPRSVARLWTFDGRLPDAALFRERFESGARAAAAQVVPPETTGYRAVNSEGDLCPGVLLDLYGETALLELLTEGTREVAAGAGDGGACEVFARGGSMVRETGAARDRRRHASRRGRQAGSRASIRFPSWRTACGSSPTSRAVRRPASTSTSGRTASRLRALARGRDGAEPLFLFGRLLGRRARRRRRAGGGRGLLGARPGARPRAPARERLPAGTTPTSFGPMSSRSCAAASAAGEAWDIVVCDPPAFAKQRADVDRAARAYKDVNRLAMSPRRPGRLAPDLLLLGPVDADLFQKIVFSASLEARVPFSLDRARQGAGPDHPVSLDCPEGEYLKGLWLHRRT